MSLKKCKCGQLIEWYKKECLFCIICDLKTENEKLELAIKEIVTNIQIDSKISQSTFEIMSKFKIEETND